MRYLLYIPSDLTFVRKSSRCRTGVEEQSAEPATRQSTMQKKSSATEGVSTRPASTAVSWVNTMKAPWHPKSILKFPLSHRCLSVVLREWSQDQQHQHPLGMGGPPGGPPLSEGGCSPEHSPSNHLPSSEAIPLKPNLRMSWPATALGGENLNLEATFTKCDLAKKDTITYLEPG